MSFMNQTLCMVFLDVQDSFSSWLLRASLSEKKNHTRNSEIKSSCETLETPIEKKKPWAMVVKHEFEDIGFWVGE